MNKRHIGFDLPWPQKADLLSRLRHFLTPHPGTLILTIVVVLGLLWAQSVGALTLGRPTSEPAAPSTNSVAYQGRLADASGTPLTGTYGMIFRLYNVSSGGVPLWEEQWTGPNSVAVSDGLFNVLLGSLTPIPQSIITGNNSLFLGITVGSDDEMTPRIQLGTVPYATQALTVPDNTIGTAKLTDQAVTTAKIANGAITADKLAPGLNLVPPGTIVMWSGSLATIPAGWALCDGTNGTPDLRDRFIVGAGSSYAVAATGGTNQVALTVEQLPTHSHSASVSQYEGFLHSFSKADPENGDPKYGRWTAVYKDPMVKLGAHSHTVTIDNTGGGLAHENRPPYYALAFIMKLP